MRTALSCAAPDAAGVERRAGRAGRCRPSVDQWPKAIGVPAVRAAGRVEPGRDSPAARRRRRPWSSNSSVPSARDEADPRQHVDDEAQPLDAGRAIRSSASGSLPYIASQELARRRVAQRALDLGGERERLSPGPTAARRRHARISQPCVDAPPCGRWRSQSSQASRSGASRMSSSVSLRCARPHAVRRRRAGAGRGCRAGRRPRRRGRAAGAASPSESRAAVDQVAEHVERGRARARSRSRRAAGRARRSSPARRRRGKSIGCDSATLAPASDCDPRCARAWTLPCCSS